MTIEQEAKDWLNTKLKSKKLTKKEATSQTVGIHNELTIVRLNKEIAIITLLLNKL